MYTPMYNRHNEVPLLHTRQGKMDANHYNHVLTALKQLGKQIRFPIPKLKHLDLILQKDAWIVVDKAQSDFPILAWMNFETEGRDSLHESIPCEVRIFHYAASMILKRTLDAMELVLGEELSINTPDDCSIIPFKKYP